TTRRMLLRPVDAPLPDRGGSTLEPGGLVLVTDDPRGIADALAGLLRQEGLLSLRVRHTGRTWDGTDPWQVEADLTSPSSIATVGERGRRLGPVTGVIHLWPLREPPGQGIDSDSWMGRMRSEVHGLFGLAREFADDLERSSRGAGAALVAATGLGGGFA